MTPSDDAAESAAHGRVISRRRLIAGTSVAAGAHLLGGAWFASVVAVGGAQTIHGPAGATQQAVRGEQVQITPPPMDSWRPGQFITHVDTVTRRMALTFDDGPSPFNTPAVLRTLAGYRIRATFFLVGVNVRAFPAVARSIVDEGHELGNHSIYHTPYRSSALASQIGGNQAIIRDVAGITPVVHRAPGLTRGGAILAACAGYGLYEAHTHMSTFDYLSPRRSAAQLAADFVRHHRNGAIPIYHDGGNRRPTPAALPMIIEYGLSVGYTFVTATELVNSGVPQPLSRSYSLTSELQSDHAVEDHVDRCGYDAESELLSILDDGSLAYRDRSRVVEVLADIEAAKAE